MCHVTQYFCERARGKMFVFIFNSTFCQKTIFFSFFIKIDFSVHVRLSTANEIFAQAFVDNIIVIIH